MEDSLHSTETWQSRSAQMSETKLEKSKKKKEKRITEDAKEMKDNGLIPCPEVDPVSKAHCKCFYNPFSRMSDFNKHMASGKHTFESRNARDLVCILASDPEKGVLRSGSRMNRSSTVVCVPVEEGSISDWTHMKCFQTGCYNKPGRKANFSASKELIRELREMFDAGENDDDSKKKGKQKYTAESAREILQNKVTDDGFLKYSKREGNTYGQLPTISYIKLKFSEWSRGKRNGDAKVAVDGALVVNKSKEGMMVIKRMARIPFNQWNHLHLQHTRMN